MAETSYDPQKVQAILQDYLETLEVLTINSKPLINDLTMAADRYKPLAAQIVGVIESRLFEVSVNQKLPLLYLLDSIMKNLKGRYIEVINTKVVAIFCHCFEKLTDPKTRISLYRLRQTWNPFIVKKKLAAIDKHVHALDPNWPVTATVTAPTSPTIHVNPDFLPAGEKGGKVFSSSFTNSTSSSQASTTAGGSSGLQSSRAKTAPAKEVAPPSAPTSSTTTAPVTLEQKRKNVLEAMKRKKEALLAKGSTSGSTVSTQKQGTGSSADSGKPPPVRNSSLADPRKKAPLAGSSGSTRLQRTPPVAETRRGKKRSLHSPRRPLSSRSSLSPDYDSKVDGRKRAKVSSRPRSASPTPQSSARQNRHGEKEEGKGGGRKDGGGLGEILKGLDITSLMGSIQRVKEQTEGDRASPAKEEDPKVDEPPPEKKPKLDNDVIASAPTLSAHKEVGGARAEVGGATLLAEDEDGIPAIKSSHLDLDDIPMELLPTHQEKIMKQVERQLKSGRLSEEQHSTLVKQLDQLYALQRKKENGREGRGADSPADQRKSPSPPCTSQTDHPSDSHRSSNHLPPSPPSSVPPPTLSDTNLPPPSPPHCSAPHIVDRHPHTHPQHQNSPPPRDRYPPPRQFPQDYPPRGPRGGPRLFRGRGPGRGRRPYDRHPHPLPPSGRGAAIDWYGQGPPPERGRGRGHEGNPENVNYPQNQGNTGSSGGSDPTKLFGKLVEMGFIKEEGEGPPREEEGGGAPRQPQGAGPPDQGGPPPPFAIPKLTFTVATLKKPYSSLVHLMYMGDPCATCGLRFRDRSTQNYSSHLDWHYKMNSRDKTLQRPRHWFLHPEDWIKFEESMANEENREPLVLEREVEGMEEGGEGEGGLEDGQESSCQVLPGEEAEVCTICAEQFEQFWEEELEEWHFREAIRHEGKLYHTYCYQDAKESGELDKSLQQPSPVETDQKPLAVACEIAN